MRSKLFVVCLAVLLVGAGFKVAAQSPVASESKKTIGRDSILTIKRDIKLKYVGPNTEDEPSYTTDVIDIEWPVDIRLISYSGKNASEDSIVHRRQIEEIQSLFIEILFHEYNISDINEEIDKLSFPGKEWIPVFSVPEPAYKFDLDLDQKAPACYTKRIVELYLACDKWITFEIKYQVGDGVHENAIGWPDWITIPRDRTAWNHPDISLISALDPSNYTIDPISPHADEILSLIKKAAGDSYGFFSTENGMMYPNRMRPEKTGITFIYYMPISSWFEYFVSYDDLKPYLEPSVYNILAGGKDWSE